MTCDARNCLFPNSDLLRGSHRLQLPVFLSAAIRQPDTEVQPNSHLLQSQEHNVQIKKVENSLRLISMQRLPVHLLAREWKFWHSGAFRNMRMILFRQCAVLTAMGGHWGRGLYWPLLAAPWYKGAGQERAGERGVLILGAAHYLLNQHITAVFVARAAELFTSVFSTGQKLALVGHDRTH